MQLFQGGNGLVRLLCQLIPVEADPVLAVLLHDIQGAIRLLDQLIIISSLLRDHNSSKRSPERDLHILSHQFLCHRHDLPVHAGRHLTEDRLILHSLHEHGEFISTHAAADVLDLRIADQDRSKALQDSVSHIMTIQIIDQLKAVQVHHEQRSGFLLARCGKHLRRTVLIQKSCQTVDGGFLCQTADLFQVLHDILHPSQQGFRPEGLTDEIGGSEIKSLILHILCIIRSHIHDPHILTVFLLQDLMHLKTVRG